MTERVTRIALSHVEKLRRERLKDLAGITDPIYAPISFLNQALNLSLRQMEAWLTVQVVGLTAQEAREIGVAFAEGCGMVRAALGEVMQVRADTHERICDGDRGRFEIIHFLEITRTDRKALLILRQFEHTVARQGWLSNDMRAVLHKALDDVTLTLGPATLEQGYG